MLGLLLVRDSEGRLGYGRAFSGLLEGEAEREGWVPPLHLPAELPSEAPTIRRLAELKSDLITLNEALKSHPYPQLAATWKQRREAMQQRHRQAKQQRDRDRAANSLSEAALQAESRAESAEKRRLREEQGQALDDPQREYDHLRSQIAEARAERKTLSRALQAEMHEQFGQSVESLLGCPISHLFPQGPPTGTGDCCAPKLLAWAARHRLRPLALAEMWWGPTSVGGRLAGEFYPACQERCQPLLGPLLAKALRQPVKVLYNDPTLVIIDKPSGLLSVPGRYGWSQESVLDWVEAGLLPVHRLDLETSGLLVLARTASAQASLSKQFEERRVQKIYQALLVRDPEVPEGRVEAALRAENSEGGVTRYTIDKSGLPAITDYRMLEEGRVELRPLTGRSHQLRVHMARALGCPIRGDRLYGQGGERLKLHAWKLRFQHPTDGRKLEFEAPLPF